MKIFVSLIVLLVVIWFLRLMLASPDSVAGLQNGRLRDCPESPNCVCSEASDPSKRIAALPVTSCSAPIEEIKAIVLEEPRTQLVRETPTYLHVTFTTRLMRYVDDVEFLWDTDEHLVHMRSASRLGYSDLGANRARMEKLRRLLESRLCSDLELKK